MRCDHTVDADVEALVDRVREERGHIDLLVNNVWGGYEGRLMGIPMVPFWEQPRSQWESMFVAGLRAQLVMSQLAAPLMVERGGLIVGARHRWGETNRHHLAGPSAQRVGSSRNHAIGAGEP